MIIGNPVCMKNDSPLPSSYFALSALTSILRNRFCYCPYFIEEEIGIQGVKPLSKATQLVNNRTEPKLSCCKYLMHWVIQPLCQRIQKAKDPRHFIFSEQALQASSLDGNCVDPHCLPPLPMELRHLLSWPFLEIP